MSKSCKLTIAVLTMNRKEQLFEALDSCLLCRLPLNTEFLILDNGSQDGTPREMERYIAAHPDVWLDYHFSQTNLGVGGGRAFLFEKASGEYVYFLDDDAVIAPESYDRFFVDSLQFLDTHPQVASMTTQVYDELCGYERTQLASKTHQVGGLPRMFFYLGLSHFLRKSSFDSPLYFPIRYGAEEYAPSIRAADRGYFHVYEEKLRIIHKPKVNKWVEGSAYMRNIIISGAAVIYATKKLLYPRVFHPVLYLGYRLRCRKHMAAYPGAKKEADAMARRIIAENPCKRVRFGTVIRLYRTFGKTVL